MPHRPEDTLSLADLETWSEPGTHLAVLGHPIKHSLSPHMHNAALRLMGGRDPRFNRWRYWKFDVPPDRLAEALPRFHAAGFVGLNLTVPHKVIAFGRIARVDPAARPIGAVNTLRRLPDGWEGHNTDGHGLAEGIARELGRRLAGADVLLLGAGGAARGAAVECLRLGCRSLTVGNRSSGSLGELLALLQPLAGAIPVHGFQFPHAPAHLPAGAIVINATSAGLTADEPAPIDLATLPRPAGVFDMIYNPPVSPLLHAARRLGVPAANGLAMLVHQGARALEIWSESTVPAGEMRRAAEAALKG